MDIFEKEIHRRGTPYFGGKRAGMLDYVIWPWFERMPIFLRGRELPNDRFPGMVLRICYNNSVMVGIMLHQTCVPSIIHSARRTVPPVAITILASKLLCFVSF